MRARSESQKSHISRLVLVGHWSFTASAVLFEIKTSTLRRCHSRRREFPRRRSCPGEIALLSITLWGERENKRTIRQPPVFPISRQTIVHSDVSIAFRRAKLRRIPRLSSLNEWRPFNGLWFLVRNHRQNYFNNPDTRARDLRRCAPLSRELSSVIRDYTHFIPRTTRESIAAITRARRDEFESEEKPKNQNSSHILIS